MANEPGRVRRALVRVISDDNLDLYLLGTGASVFTVLGITGISDVKTMTAVVVALLAVLAFSQIKSRRLLEQVRNATRGGPDAVFSKDFPIEMIRLRERAQDVLLIGDARTRTVQGLLTEMTAILKAGGRVRVMVVDPADEALVEATSRRVGHHLGADRMRGRIMTTLDELTTLRSRVGGRLEIRVSSSVPTAGFNCLDTNGRHGLVSVQHYEYRPDREATPIFTLQPQDGAWYQHFVDEAERLWTAGTEWPLSPADLAARARRPAFSDEFGPELDVAIDETADLFVTGTARNSVLNGSYERLKKKLLGGSRIRFLLVDPDSPAVATAADRYYAERSPDSVRDRVLHSLRLLAELKATTGGDLSVRLIPHALAVIVIATEAALFAEYFPYQQPGTPKFVLRPGDAGHERFLAEAETMWRTAKPHEL